MNDEIELGGETGVDFLQTTARFGKATRLDLKGGGEEGETGSMFLEGSDGDGGWDGWSCRAEEDGSEEVGRREGWLSVGLRRVQNQG